MNIRRALATSLAAITAGAGLFGIAVASTSLGDFVTATDGTLSSPIVVIGSNAGSATEYPKDVAGAADIAAALAGYATTTTAVGTGATTSVSGGAMVTSDLNKTYLSNSTTDYAKEFRDVKGTLTKSDLPTLLATQSLIDNNSTTITYSQQILLRGGQVLYGTYTGATEPTLYSTFGSKPYNYTAKIIFMGGLDTSAVDTNYGLTLFGKEYTFGQTVTNTTIELFSSTGAQNIVLSGASDEKEVTVDNTAYKFKLNGWSADGTYAYLLINDQATTPAGWSVGYHLIPGTNIRVYVKAISIVYTGAQEASGQVELFIGADKLKIVNNTAVEKNDVALVNTKAFFTSSSSKINALEIDIGPDVNTYLIDGGEFVDPLFGSFKFVLGDMTPELKSDTRDKITIAKDGTNKIKVTFTNKEGTQYAVDVFTYDTSSNVWEKTMDGTYRFHTQEGNNTGINNITQGEYFVLTSAGDKATYIFKYSAYYPSTTATLRYVTLTDVSTGVAQKVYYNSDPYLYIGSNKFNVTMLGYGYGSDYALIVDLNGDATIEKADEVRLYTEKEAIINVSGYTNTEAEVIIEESPLYRISGSNEPAGQKINVTGVYAASTYVSFSITPTTAAGNQIGTANKYRGITEYGTYVERDTDSDTIEVYYPGTRPAYANVAVGSAPQFVTAGGTSTVETAIKITNPVAKLDSEITSPSTLASDLVLVGGPCANTLVKTLLNTEWNETDSCSAWSSHVTGSGIIKEITNAFSSGQKALIVAGTNADDTRTLAAKVMQGTLAYPA